VGRTYRYVSEKMEKHREGVRKKEAEASKVDGKIVPAETKEKEKEKKA
jgi:hypothetical protein